MQIGPYLLWPQGAPQALGRSDVDRPSLHYYAPQRGQAPFPALLVLPGGGYELLSSREGHDYAEFFSRWGVACYVLDYRLGVHGYRHPVPLEDARRAMRWIRSQRETFQIDPDRVGVIGSSAGGHLAACLMTLELSAVPGADPLDALSARPDLGILCYPVISFLEHAHENSKRTLLGPEPDPELLDGLSAQKQVTQHCPPTFLWHCRDDESVPWMNSALFAQALERQGVDHRLLLFDKGGHGLGLDCAGPAYLDPHPWTSALESWLTEQGFLKD